MAATGPLTKQTAAEPAAAEWDLDPAEVLLAVLVILQQQVKKPEVEAEVVEVPGEELVKAWKMWLPARTAITCKSKR